MNDESSKLNFAIVGAGPAGIYAAEAILKKAAQENITCRIDLIEALSTPYGLVRSGVAPDHFKIKEVSRLFEKTLSNEAVSLIGNVHVGKDISIEELRMHYHAVILAHGTQKDRTLGIPGESLPGSFTATSFVGWYNSHPWFEDINFDLKKKTAVLIGQGNVAIDVARVLLKSVEELHSTDIGAHAEEALTESTLEDIYLIGRRGPLQMACTDKELKELGEIPGVSVVVKAEDLVLTDDEKAWLEQAPKGTRRNYDILKEFSEKPAAHPNYLSDSKRRVHIRFFLSPLEIIGETEVSAIRFAKNTLSGDLDKRSAAPNGETEDLATDLVFRSVGYLGEGIKGLPFDTKRGVYPNQNGKVTENDTPIKGLYTSGWIKRGPSGVIGTNKADSVETVQSIFEDIESLKDQQVNDPEQRNPEKLWAKLRSSGIPITDFSDWKTIEAEEKSQGEQRGKTSHKFRSQKEMVSYILSKK